MVDETGLVRGNGSRDPIGLDVPVQWAKDHPSWYAHREYFEGDFDRIKDVLEPEPEEDRDPSGDKEKAERFLSELSAFDRRVVEMRYGLGFGRPLTYEEIGKALGITREKALWVETWALFYLQYRVRRGSPVVLSHIQWRRRGNKCLGVAGCMWCAEAFREVFGEAVPTYCAWVLNA